MDDQQTFTEESLRRLSYVDLQRCAKMHGIKANVKAEKLIVALVSENAQNPVNSVLLKEEDAVEADKLIVALVSDTTNSPGNSVLLKEKDAIVESHLVSDENESDNSSVRPRRKRTRTFSIEKPLSVESNLVSDECKSENSSVRPRRRRTRTFSIEKPLSVETSDVSCITTPLKTTSGKCNTPMKSSVKSILSSRKTGKCNKSRSANCYRVSFITPDKKDLKTGCNTPASSPSSIKCRPQTPASRRHLSAAKRKNRLIVSPISETPKKMKKWFSKNESSVKNSKDEKASLVFCTEEKKSVKTPLASVKSSKKSELIRSCTPNFKKIHQQVFDKMESLDEYQQRKQTRICKLGKNLSTKKITIKTCEAKSLPKVRTKILCKDMQKKNTNATTLTLRSRKIISKIPIPYQGIRFIPSVISIKKIKTDFSKFAEASEIQKSTTTSEKTCLKEKSQQSIKTGRENIFRFGKGSMQKMPLLDVINTPQKDRSLVCKKTFDLKASLARKLPYKPYKGSLKPLSDTKVNHAIVTSVAAHQPPLGEIVAKKREGARDILKGVRKNRRFELQMSHRGLAA